VDYPVSKNRSGPEWQEYSFWRGGVMKQQYAVEGATLKSVGLLHNITSERVRQILMRHARRAKRREELSKL
jgi:hypothetical protein